MGEDKPNGNEGLIHRISEAGISALHPETDMDRIPQALVAPTLKDEIINTLQFPLLPRACWKLEDVRFGFDSSFVLPEVRAEMPLLARIIDKNTETNAGGVELKPPISIFGHADPVGEDDYNKTLSGRRATVIYALLTRRVDLWEKLYSQPLGFDHWGDPSIKTMLGALGFVGTMGAKNFQAANGLKPDGVVGPKTREKLFLAYMDFLCRPEFKLEKKDFLGNGADPDGKADYQGCGEFNPILILSRDENRELSKPGNIPERNRRNAPNRRVMIFLFRPGRRVVPDKWPCPRAGEGVGACRKRLFSDGEARRASGPALREFKDTGDTFACRFYHRFAAGSPCEHPLPALKGLAYLSVVVFFHQQPISGLKVTFAEIGPDDQPGQQEGDEVKTDSDGVAKLLTPAPIGRYICRIQYQPPTVITTVPDIEDPFMIVLPIGRPYYDFEGDIPFKPKS
jgi:hypothetical protein